MSKSNLLGKENLAEKMKKIKQEMDAPAASKSGETKKLELKEDKITESRIKKDKSKSVPKLFVSGRLDRKNCSYIAKSLIILEQIEKEIKEYCRGGEVAILNYLLKEGLKIVKASSSTISVDISEIETDIN